MTLIFALALGELAARKLRKPARRAVQATSNVAAKARRKVSGGLEAAKDLTRAGLERLRTLDAKVLGRGVEPMPIKRLSSTAIDRMATVVLSVDGVVAKFLPHRLWQQEDGSYLLEAFQVLGPVEWPPPQARPKVVDAHTPFPLQPRINGRGMGWRYLPLERVIAIELLDEKFDVQPGYNPNPVRPPRGRVEKEIKLRNTTPSPAAASR